MPRAPRRRVCVITTVHLSSCPRMVKAADALHEAGYEVDVVYASSLPGHTKLDAHLLRSRRWTAHALRLDPQHGRLLRIHSGLSQRIHERVAFALGIDTAPLAAVARAHGRLTGALTRAARAIPADLYYGGTAMGLAPTYLAARARGVPFGIDLEDFHTAEQDDSPQARLAHLLVERVERDVIPAAAFVTAAGEALADAYADKWGRRPLSINNVFPLPATPPELARAADAGLKLYWFSQTIGPGRGLEDAVRAAGRVPAPTQLHLRGGTSPAYLDSLLSLARDVAPNLRVQAHRPEPPDLMVELCRAGDYDVGLALEQTHVFSRTVCLTNKLLTYLAGGLAIAATDTPGQRGVVRDLGEGAFGFPPGDVEALARGLTRWASDPQALARARRAAWEGAVRRWHWDHPLEKGALIGAVASVIGPSDSSA